MVTSVFATVPKHMHTGLIIHIHNIIILYNYSARHTTFYLYVIYTWEKSRSLEAANDAKTGVCIWNAVRNVIINLYF